MLLARRSMVRYWIEAWFKDHFPSSSKGILSTRDQWIASVGDVLAAKNLLLSWTKRYKIDLHKAYLHFRNAPAVGSWTKTIANPRIMSSHRIICSLAVQNQLATMDNLQKRRISTANRCVLCEISEETKSHLLMIFHESRMTDND
ncbi:hypothetical protein KSS87_003982 [Heliosperma pusillum]|nr:hypothetical protein KSS87_003982 [Heliosperma pusillum]